MLRSAGHRVCVPTLPGRDPSDDAVLAGTGIEDLVAVALDAYDSIGEPAVVMGHSIGGLLAQRIAAARSPRAVVLLAPVPPGVLWPRLRSLPHLLAILPRVLAAELFLPSPRTMRAVPLNTLPAAEREALIPRLVRDSGRVFRQMSTGARPTRVDAAAVTCPVLVVSAGADRNVAPWLSRRIAARYRAEHHVHPGAPHWIVAESLLDDVAPPVLKWLERTLA